MVNAQDVVYGETCSVRNTFDTKPFKATRHFTLGTAACLLTVPEVRRHAVAYNPVGKKTESKCKKLNISRAMALKAVIV